MYDKVLAKEEFYSKLKEAGFAPNEIDGLWVNLERQFYSLLFLNAAKSLSDEKLREVVGADKLGPEDLDKMVENLGNYVKNHIKDIDMVKVIKESAEQAHQNLAKLIMED